jgi:hypothetical protein
VAFVVLIEIGKQRRPVEHAGLTADEIDVAVTVVHQVVPQPIAIAGVAGLGVGDRVASGMIFVAAKKVRSSRGSTPITLEAQQSRRYRYSVHAHRQRVDAHTATEAVPCSLPCLILPQRSTQRANADQHTPSN